MYMEKHIAKNDFTCAENDVGSGVRYRTDVISGRFRTQFETSCYTKVL